MLNVLRLFTVCCMLLLVISCSPISSIFGSGDSNVAIVSQPPASIHNLQLGRQYATEGRYELAKEHYLMALAASNEENKETIARELHAVDMMIKTQR